MMRIEDCLKYETKIYLTREEKETKSHILRFFDKKTTPKLYIKDFNHAEFIGEKLCNIKNIKCAHYFLVGLGMYKLERSEMYGKIAHENYDIKLGSYDFKNKTSTYFFYKDDNILSISDRLNEILNLTPTRKNREELLNELLSMFALDIFMGQQDRYLNNIMFEKKDNGEIHLAPLFDFELSLKKSYIDHSYVYKNGIHSFKTIDDIKKFIEENPYFKEELLSYLDIDLVDKAKFSYSERGLKLPETVTKSLDEFSCERKELIKEITR